MKKVYDHRFFCISLLGFVLIFLFSPVMSAQDEDMSGEEILLKSMRVQAGRIHLPQGYDKNKEYPLVIGIHGKGGTALGFASVREKIKKKDFIFLVPEAPYEYGGGRLGRPAFNWFYMTKDKKVWEWADPITVEYLADVCRVMKERYRVSEVVLLGFSEGVAAAYMTAFTYPEEISGVIAFAGILPPEGMFPGEKINRSAGKFKVFIGHGKRDRAISIKVSEDAFRKLKKKGFDVRFSSFGGGHTVDGAVLNKSIRWMLSDRPVP